MDKINPPASLDASNLAETWKKFRQRFELYLQAIEGDQKSAKQQASMFLTVIGEDSLEIYNGFTWADEADKLKLEVILQKFEDYCVPKKSVTYERYKFFTCIPKAGESFDVYLSDLMNKSKGCEFRDLRDSLIRDRVICTLPRGYQSLKERFVCKNVQISRMYQVMGSGY